MEAQLRTDPLIQSEENQQASGSACTHTQPTHTSALIYTPSDLQYSCIHTSTTAHCVMYPFNLITARLP